MTMQEIDGDTRFTAPFFSSGAPGMQQQAHGGSPSTGSKVMKEQTAMVTVTAGKWKAKPPSLIFVYGTLKQGFPNHPLLQDMMATGDATFLGFRRTLHRLPLVCGPYRVPFLLNFPGCGHYVSGELYAVSPAALVKMDELEGVTKGHYERLPINIEFEEEEAAAETEAAVVVEAYYGHRSYAEALWRKSGEEGYEVYTERVATGYVRRKDRPHHLTFLDQIRLFVSSCSDSANGVME